MDLLGSILNSMDKPPSTSDKQKNLMKKQKEEIEKRQQREQLAMKQVRDKAVEKLNKFLKDSTLNKYEFPPMDKVYRTVIYDVSEVAGVTAFSVGEEGIDRRIVVYKKDYTPTEDELNALRRGEEWTPEKAQQLAEQRELEKKEELDSLKRGREKFIPATNYKDKYSHLIGTVSAKEGAQKTQTNRSYGFVPSENKKDQRSIEQTLADIQSKKRLKTTHHTEQAELPDAEQEKDE